MDAPGEDRSPALALVNSRRMRPRSTTVDDLQTPGDLARWLSRRGFDQTTTSIGSPELRSVLELREAIRELLTARVREREPDSGAIDIVNAASLAAPVAPVLSWDTGYGPAVRERRDAGDEIARILAAIACDAIDLITGERLRQLRACQAPDCIRFLLADHARRRWCSKRCGDRVRAADHYARIRLRPED